MSPFPRDTLFPGDDVFPGPPDSPTGGLVPPPIRTQLPSLRLSVEVITPSGRIYRWAEDERDPENVIQGLSFSTAIPGGFETLDVSLTRKPGYDYHDLERLSTIRVLGPGGQVAGEYRLERTPRTVDLNHMQVSPSAVGWQAHLADDSSFTETFVGRDLDRWTGPSLSWQESAYSNFVTWVGGPEVLTDEVNGTPTLQLTAEHAGAITWLLAQYDTGSGSFVDSVYAAYDVHAISDQTTARIGSAADDAWLSPAESDQFEDGGGVMPVSGTITYTSTVSNRYAVIQVQDNLDAEAQMNVNLSDLTVWGKTGVTKRGTAPDDGVYASDVIANAIARCAPRLTYELGTTILDSGFIIPHCVFHDPVSPADVISEVDRYNLWDWAVWEAPSGRPDQPTFYYRPRGHGTNRWDARVGVSRLSSTGPQVDRLWNGVVVSYQDVDGSTRRVGPPLSGAETEAAALEDTDPLNPINQRGMRRWAMLDMGIVSTPAAAAQVGGLFLSEQKELDGSGSAQIIGSAVDSHGIERPAWAIRAGDQIRFTDASDTSYRRIIRTQYDHDSRTNSLDLDAPPDAMEALLARWSIKLKPLGL